MYFLWKRWSRAGYMPPWFYALLAGGFLVLAILAAFQSAWLGVAIALLMVGVTVLAARYMPRLARASDASNQHYYSDEEARR